MSNNDLMNIAYLCLPGHAMFGLKGWSPMRLTHQPDCFLCLNANRFVEFTYSVSTS